MKIDINTWKYRLLMAYLYTIITIMIFVLAGSRSIWLLSVMFLLPFCYNNTSSLSLRLGRAYPFILILLWCFISSYWSNWPGFVRVETFFQGLIFLTTLLISEVYSPKNIFRVLRDVALLCITVVFVSLLVSPSSNLAFFASVYAHKNTTGQFLALSLIFLVFSKDKVKYSNVFIYVGILLLLLTRSGTSILAFCSATSIGYLFYRMSDVTRRFWVELLTYIGYGVLLLFFIITYVYHLDILDFTYNNLTDEALTGRGNIWKVMLFHAEDNIIKGFGYASVWWHGDFSEIHFTDLALTNPEWVDKLAGSDGGFIDIVLSIGLVGFFMFITFLYATFINMLKKTMHI